MHCSITIVWPWYWIVFCNLIQLFSTDAALLFKECQTKIHLLCHIVLSLTAATLIRRPIGTMAKRHNGMKADRMDNFFVGHPLGPEHSEFQIKCVIYKALSHLNLKDKWRFSSISETVILQAKQQAVKWNIKVQTKTIIVHRQLPEKFSVHFLICRIKESWTESLLNYNVYYSPLNFEGLLLFSTVHQLEEFLL